MNSPQAKLLRAPSPTYVMQAPVLSTLHLRCATHEAIERPCLDGLYEDLLCFPLTHRGALSAYGVLVYVDEDDDFSALAARGLDDLAAVLIWARSNAYEWLRFDGESGDILTELPTYESTWA